MPSRDRHCLALAAIAITLPAWPCAAQPWTAGRGAEVGASSVAEGTDGSGVPSGAGGVRAAGEVRTIHLIDDPDDRSKELVTGTAAGADATLGVEDGSAMVRGRAWVEFLRIERKRGADAMARHDWTTGGIHLDYQTRVPLSRRRELATTSQTGTGLHFEGAGWVFPRPTGDDTLVFLVDELKLLDTPLGIWGAAHGQVGLWRRARDPDGDGVAHTVDVLTIDSAIGGFEDDAGAMITRLVPYAERERGLPGGVRADVRVGYAWTCVCETPDRPALRKVTAGILDGAVRRDVGPATVELRYDRDLYQTVDALVALDDRVSARATWNAGEWSLAGGAYAADTTFRNSNGPAMPAVRGRSDGVDLHAIVTRRRWILDAGLEGGHSYYAAATAASTTPALGWRASVDLSWRVGDIVAAPGHTPQ